LDLGFALAGDGLMHCKSGGVLARHQRSSRGRAKWFRTRLSEHHAIFSQPIHVRRFVELAAVRRAVHPAHVIDQEYDDVRLLQF
jgi:hypothetical protein